MFAVTVDHVDSNQVEHGFRTSFYIQHLRGTVVPLTGILRQEQSYPTRAAALAAGAAICYTGNLPHHHAIIGKSHVDRSDGAAHGLGPGSERTVRVRRCRCAVKQ